MPELVIERAVLSVSPDTHELFAALAERNKMSFSQVVQTLAMQGAAVQCAQRLNYETVDLWYLTHPEGIGGLCRAWLDEGQP